MTLDEYLSTRDPKLTDAAFGELVGMSQSQISRLRRQLHRPSWSTMEAIERVTKGKVKAAASDWPVKAEAAE